MVGISFSGSLFPSPTKTCVMRENSNPQEIVEWFTRNINTCSISHDSKQVIIGSECKRNNLLNKEEISHSQMFSTTATSPIVTLTSGLFETLENESQLAGIIAHELGHYYRSHPAMWTPKYNFFYYLEKQNPQKKPLPDESLRELGEKAISASKKESPSLEEQEVLKEAYQKQLGYYTFEQEADDLAIEWLVKIGLHPKALIDKMFIFLQNKEIPTTDFEWGYEKCKSSYLNYWQKDGQYEYVPIGDFSNPHHSLCYRIFNIDREIRAHRYTLKALERQFHQKEWKNIKEIVSQIHKDYDM